MSLPRYAELARRALSEEVPAAQAGPGATDRSSAIRAIEEALRAKRRRRLQLRAASFAAAALAVAAVVVLFVRRHEGAAPAQVATVSLLPDGGAMGTAMATSTVIARSSGDGAAITGGSPAGGSDEALLPGSRVAVRPQGRTRLDFTSGTRIDLHEASELAVVSLGPSQIFSLAGGSLRADVAKLKTGERFIVRTLDAEVEVHGTSFLLGTASPVPSCGAGTTTRLTVYEGVVTVRARGLETRVAAGSVWPADCPAEGATAAAPSGPGASSGPSARLASAAPGASFRAEAAPPPGSAAVTVPLSDLTSQNDLFAAAVQETQAGRLEAAIERYDAFLARYPDAPLAESAASQRMKVLRDTHDAARAAAAARAYLARYPEGYSRRDAEAILGDGR